MQDSETLTPQGTSTTLSTANMQDSETPIPKGTLTTLSTANMQDSETPIPKGTLTTLPLELREMIVEALGSDFVDAIRNLMLASREFSFVAPMLYKRITYNLANSQHFLGRLVRTLAKRPELGEETRSIKFVGRWRINIADTFSAAQTLLPDELDVLARRGDSLEGSMWTWFGTRFQATYSLEYWREALRRGKLSLYMVLLLSYMPNLECLSPGVDFWSAEWPCPTKHRICLRNAIEKCENITDIDFGMISLDDIDPSRDWNTIRFSPELGALFRITRLTSARIHLWRNSINYQGAPSAPNLKKLELAVYFLDVQELRELLSKIPNLQSLAIRIHCWPEGDNRPGIRWLDVSHLFEVLLMNLATRPALGELLPAYQSNLKSLDVSVRFVQPTYGNIGGPWHSRSTHTWGIRHGGISLVYPELNMDALEVLVIDIVCLLGVFLNQAPPLHTVVPKSLKVLKLTSTVEAVSPGYWYGCDWHGRELAALLAYFELHPLSLFQYQLEKIVIRCRGMLVNGNHFQKLRSLLEMSEVTLEMEPIWI